MTSPRPEGKTETRAREELLIAVERMGAVLRSIGAQVTTEEGDRDATEEDIGLPVAEVIEMAHDSMIEQARAVLADPIVAKVLK